MKLEKIITLANKNVRPRFLAMERSLRAVGCNLPLLVIPYDETRFDLPANAEWWAMPEMVDWLARSKSHPTMRKYQCLLESNYQFVDSDVCFLKDPAQVLAPESGFVTSCGHWHNPGHTYTDQSLAHFKSISTTWQKSIFNTGQFACDRSLYPALADLQRTAERRDAIDTCIRFQFHEQPGVNLLVALSGVPVTNLTLPPRCMESTWAGDYPDADYRRYWSNPDKQPYLIHWAGTAMWGGRPVNDFFFQYLTASERQEWDALVEIQRQRSLAQKRSWRARARRVRDALRLLTKPA
jgi:hypothetical protein